MKNTGSIIARKVGNVLIIARMAKNEIMNINIGIINNTTLVILYLKGLDLLIQSGTTLST